MENSNKLYTCQECGKKTPDSEFVYCHQCEERLFCNQCIKQIKDIEFDCKCTVQGCENWFCGNDCGTRCDWCCKSTCSQHLTQCSCGLGKICLDCYNTYHFCNNCSQPVCKFCSVYQQDTKLVLCEKCSSSTSNK